MNVLKSIILLVCFSVVVSCSSANKRDAFPVKLIVSPEKPQVVLNGTADLSVSGIGENGYPADVAEIKWKADKNSAGIIKLSSESGAAISVTGKKLGKFIINVESDGLKTQVSGEVVKEIKQQTSTKSAGKK